jgi:hypothetical protein
MDPPRTDHHSRAREFVSTVDDPCPICSASSLLKTWPHPGTCDRARSPHTTMFLEGRAWRRKRRRVNLMTIVAGLAAFNTVASIVAGGPNWWTRAWAVALVVALLLMLVRIVRGAVRTAWSFITSSLAF